MKTTIKAGDHVTIREEERVFYRDDLATITSEVIDVRRHQFRLAPITAVNGEARPDYSRAFWANWDDVRRAGY